MGNKSQCNDLNAGITNLEIISDLRNPSERSGKILRTNRTHRILCEFIIILFNYVLLLRYYN